VSPSSVMTERTTTWPPGSPVGETMNDVKANA
jgi:hypothetical protein